MKVVLASNNPGKIREFGAYLKHEDITLVSQADLGVTDIAETGLSFIENALIKARHAAKMTGLPALADDSGLCVAALEGAPGIYSARYAGPNATASDNIKKLLAALSQTPDEQRQATFHCVLAFVLDANDPMPLIAEGSWSGMIAKTTSGTAGFGYDPIFFLPERQQCAAELDADTKNRISHRAVALKHLVDQLNLKLARRGV